MRRAAIVSPLRTPVGTFGGTLRPLRAEDLASHIIKAVVARATSTRASSKMSFSPSPTPTPRRPASDGGPLLMPDCRSSLPGLQIDRRCGGGLQAVITAAMTVATGATDVVLAGGVESMSNIEHYTTTARWGSRSGNQVLYDRLDRGRERSQPAWRFGEISGMIETAENLAADYVSTVTAADAFAARSHRRAAAAQESGAFNDEIVPVEVPQRRGDPLVIDRDEGMRPDSTAQSLAQLPTIIAGGPLPQAMPRNKTTQPRPA